VAQIQRPNEVDGERELLTACFRSENPNFNKEDVIKHTLSGLDANHFAHPWYQKIYVALQEAVADAGKGEVSWSDVRGYIDKDSQSRIVLKEMATETNVLPVTPNRVNRVIGNIQTAYQNRRVATLAKEVEGRALVNDSTAIDTMMDGLYEITRNRFTAGAQPISHYIDAVKEEVTYRRNNTGVVGLPTGMTPFDDVIGGLQKKMLIYLGARPGMRKSVAIGEIAYNVAEVDKRALVCSPEMAAEQYIMRDACVIAGVDYDLYNKGTYTAQQEKKIQKALELLRGKNIIINEAGEQGIHSIRQDLIRYQPDVLLVDYAQLFLPSRPSYNEYKDVSMFSRELNALKKDFNIPIVAAVQLSRKVEERNPPRPVASDLRATGQLEQDADAIFMLYHAAFYADVDDFGNYSLGGETIDPTVLEFICAKNRHGKPIDTDMYVKEGDMWLYNEPTD
jgi:replicative DNA helicase